MNVLSLFDGMSCGQIALNKAGIKYDKYYSSEIDKHAIQVTQANYPETIQLGDIKEIRGSNLPKIDLLIGGSPCQGFSKASCLKGKEKKFDDERSKLFFEYVRLLKETKPKYFLLENVIMDKDSQKVFNEHLRVEPIEIDSALVSAQTRRRLYWTNIPNITQPKDKGLVISDILTETKERKTIDINQYPSLRLCKNYLAYGAKKSQNKWTTYPEKRVYFTDKKSLTLNTIDETKILLKGKVVYLTRNEIERLQTVPDNYTSAASNNQIKRILGNGWTVDVIVHIFKGLK
jgi:DNA (cytosine-5)-methyltransferase 3A